MFSATLFALLCFLLVIFLFKMAPKRSPEVLVSVARHKTAVICLKEKIHVLDMLYPGVSYSAVGHEWNLNQSTLY